MSAEKNKLYIGNLSYDVTEDDLGNFLQDKGIAIQSLTIIKDKYTNRSKGFGFLEVPSEEEVQGAIDALNEQELKGRKLMVSQARAKEKKSNWHGGGGGNRGQRNFRRDY